MPRGTPSTGAERDGHGFSPGRRPPGPVVPERPTLRPEPAEPQQTTGDSANLVRVHPTTPGRMPMVLKRLMRVFGVGGPTVETVFDSTEVAPGGTLTGRVEVTGGDHDTEIEKITLTLEAEVEHEYEYTTEDSEGEEVEHEG